VPSVTSLSYASASILLTISSGYRYGFDVMDITGLPSGTVYPALRRLEQSGLVSSKWEKESVALKDQRPARKYYAITRAGEVSLDAAVQRYPLLERLLPSLPRKPKA
jgi:PadR family transcriptional regulator PadR